jgi:hypothetical protein
VGHCDTRRAWQNHHVPQFPMGCYCAAEVTRPEAIIATIPKSTGRHAAEVTGAKAIVTMIPEPLGRRAYEMCGTFHFCAAAPPFRCPMPTDGRDLPPCQRLGMTSARCGHEVPRPMGCYLQGKINRGWNRAYRSILPFSCLLRSSPLSPALLGSFTTLDHRPPPWLLSFLLRDSR